MIYQVMMIARAGKLNMKSIKADTATKKIQSLFSFQFFILNLSENIGTSATNRYDEMNTNIKIII